MPQGHLCDPDRHTRRQPLLVLAAAPPLPVATLATARRLIGYVTFRGLPDVALTLPLAAGAPLSVPWATMTLRHLPENTIRGAFGVLTLVLGLVSLAKLLG